MGAFKPTHEICLEDAGGARKCIAVMLVDGAGYQQEEWGAGCAADWECDADGAWTFHGEAVPAGWKTVVVRPWSKGTVATWFVDPEGFLVPRFSDQLRTQTRYLKRYTG